MNNKRNRIGKLISEETCHDLVPGEMAERWQDNRRCETCLSVDFNGNNGKNVVCSLTGSVIDDVNCVNVECPLDKNNRG